MVNGSLQNELSRFYQVLENSPIAQNDVTAAAFCKARKKFSYTAFKELNTGLIDTFYQSDHVKLWRGHRLLAVDASVTKLPRSKELMSYYGTARSHSTQPACRISQLYDINNKLTVDLQVDPHSTGERNMAIKHLENTRENDVILYDRGYPAVWFFKMHLQRNVHFCARALDSSNHLKSFIQSGKREALVSFPCEERSLVRC